MTELTTPEQAVDRDRWGRPLILPPDGGKSKAYTRASTLAKGLDDGKGLQFWAKCMVAAGMASRADLQAQAVGMDYDTDKKELIRIAEEAMQTAGSTTKRNMGTALHRLTEYVDRGEPLPEGTAAAAVADVAAYTAATEGFEVVAIEEFLVCDELETAGTPDRIFRVRDDRFASHGLNKGDLVIGDTKTGRVDYPMSFAIQLAVYANGEELDLRTGRRTPHPPEMRRDVGIIVHLPAGEATASLVLLNLEAGYEAAKLAVEVRGLRSSQKRKGVYATPIEVDVPDPILAKITAAADADAVRAVWAVHEDEWNDDYTAAAKARIAEVGE